MFGSDTIEVVIGLVFIFFIMSLLCTTLTEWISRIFAIRAKTLKQGIIKLLSDDDFLKTEFISLAIISRFCQASILFTHLGTVRIRFHFMTRIAEFLFLVIFSL